MNPDYPAMVNDFAKPVISFFLFAFMLLGWVVAYQLMKEVTELRIKLGRDTQQEGIREWFLRKSAPIILPFYTFKTFIAEIKYQSILKQLLRKKKKESLETYLSTGLIAVLITHIDLKVINPFIEKSYKKKKPSKQSVLRVTCSGGRT